MKKEYVNSTIAAPVDWIEAVGNLRFHRRRTILFKN